jgi:hypothetical protein
MIRSKPGGRASPVHRRVPRNQRPHIPAHPSHLARAFITVRAASSSTVTVHTRPPGTWGALGAHSLKTGGRPDLRRATAVGRARPSTDPEGSRAVSWVGRQPERPTRLDAWPPSQQAFLIY